MEMRLIDANKLKEQTKRFADCDGINEVWQIIDKATTMDKRSRGRWEQKKLSFQDPKTTKFYYVCSHCGVNSMWNYNFCPICGCEMENPDERQ